MVLAMTDTLQLLQAALPYVALLFAFAAFWRLGNQTITLQWASKTQEPEPSKAQLADIAEQRAKLKAEREEAKLMMRSGLP